MIESDEEENRIRGVVDWYTPKMGYGFAIAEGKRYYFNMRMLADCKIISVEHGDTISFVVGNGTDGTFCKFIKLVKRRARKNN